MGYAGIAVPRSRARTVASLHILGQKNKKILGKKEGESITVGRSSFRRGFAWTKAI